MKRKSTTTTKAGLVSVKSYIFQAELVQEDDGRWSAGIPVLPGCATWGDTKEEAIRNIRDAAEAYIRDMKNQGEQVPTDLGTQVVDKPVVAITI